MSAQSLFSASEVGRRGQEIYEQTLRDRLEPGNLGRYLAIDINSGDYELGAEPSDVNAHMTTVDRLLERRPDAVVYTLLIGYPATAAIGTSI